MPKKYRLTVDPSAYETLLDYADFLWQVSPDAADRLELSFKKSLARIADNPFQFPFADAVVVLYIPPKAYRKCIFEKHYKALFRLNGYEVIIDAVIDSRMENVDL
ncbi:MAG: hypothetical protein FWG02_09080 [Holophagaceae bacterium]|nr:hypothetical protein [Holophagaceae bacterium]